MSIEKLEPHTWEQLSYLWDEYKYRHERRWQAVYKISAVVTILAEEAERDYLKQIHDDAFGKLKGTVTLKEFVDQHYLKWAKDNKCSWGNNVCRVKPLRAALGNQRFVTSRRWLLKATRADV